MKSLRYKISSEKRDKINTELLYSLASARVDGVQLILFEYSENAADTVLRCLKALKQTQKIDFYLKSSEIALSTEGSYLMNKYSEVLADIENGEPLFIVKL